MYEIEIESLQLFHCTSHVYGTEATQMNHSFVCCYLDRIVMGSLLLIGAMRLEPESLETWDADRRRNTINTICSRRMNFRLQTALLASTSSPKIPSLSHSQVFTVKMRFTALVALVSAALALAGPAPHERRATCPGGQTVDDDRVSRFRSKTVQYLRGPSYI